MFRHAGDANEAFKQLPGAHETDSFGRAQKLLKLTSGHHMHLLHCTHLHCWLEAVLPVLNIYLVANHAVADLLLIAGTVKGKIVKIRKMAAHGGFAFGKDSTEKVHIMKQQAQRKQKTKFKQSRRKAAAEAIIQAKVPSSVEANTNKLSSSS